MRTWRTIGWPSLLASIFVAGLLVVLALPELARSREAANRASCQGTLKQWGLIFSLYSREWNGMYPRMQGPPQWLVDGIPTAQLGNNCNADDGFHLTPNPTSIFPEYANDFEILRCPSLGHPDLKIMPQSCKYAGIPTRGDASFQYLGYAFVSGKMPPFDSGSMMTISDTDLSRLLGDFFDVLQRSVGNSSARFTADILERDIQLPEPRAVPMMPRILRLKEKIERYFVIDIIGPNAPPRGFVPVMWDKVSPTNFQMGGTLRLNHAPHGSNVLFEDGHVAYRPFGNDEFPLMVVFAEALAGSRLDTTAQ